MSDLRVLILAAGKGTRMKSRKAKVLHQVGGASLVEHVLATARTVSSSVSVVIGHQAETVRALMPEVSFVEQKEQLGTGHAVMAAREQLSGHKGDLLILPGDVPLISSETLKAACGELSPSAAIAQLWYWIVKSRARSKYPRLRLSFICSLSCSYWRREGPPSPPTVPGGNTCSIARASTITEPGRDMRVEPPCNRCEIKILHSTNCRCSMYSVQ